MISELISFLCCAFAISWLGWGLLRGACSSQLIFWLAGYGPTLAALLITGVRERREGLVRLIRPGSRTQPIWILICLFAPPLLMALALLGHRVFGGGLPSYQDPIHVVTSLDQWPGILIVIIYVLVFSAAGEEIGWRGFFLPRALRLASPFLASLMLGLVWAVWHLPLFWLPGTIQSQLPLSWFLLQVLGISMLYTWIYLRTEGSLLPAILFHTSVNASLGLLPILPLDNGGSFQPLWLTLALLWIAAGLAMYLEKDVFFVVPRGLNEGE